MIRTHLKSLCVAAFLLAVPAVAATPDGLLTSNTKLSLWTTAGVPSTAVHVDTNDGVVTLYGKVSSAEQKALAETTARKVDGVRSVTNLLQVVPQALAKTTDQSDSAIADAAGKQLKADTQLNGSSITVKSVDKGVLLLSGETRSLSDHLRAVRDAYRVPGVKRVVTEVTGPAGIANDERLDTALSAQGNDAKSSATDLRISAAVKLHLLTTADLPSTDINVDTDDGVVTLFGMVPSEGIKNAAGSVAGKVSGVSTVQNMLQVVPSSMKKVTEAKDGDVKRDLSLALRDRTDLKGVSTAVKNGIVRLTGTVGSAWDEVTALTLVRRVPGVRGVEDQLKIEAPAAEPARRY